MSVSDFPFEGVPVILGPLLYAEAEELSVEKLADTSAMPKTAVSIRAKYLLCDKLIDIFHCYTSKTKL